jgi:hypothetical protein
MVTGFGSATRWSYCDRHGAGRNIRRARRGFELPGRLAKNRTCRFAPLAEIRRYVQGLATRRVVPGAEFPDFPAQQPRIPERACPPGAVRTGGAETHGSRIGFPIL